MSDDTITPAAFGCVGNTIRLRSGRYLNLADPKSDQFTFGDIAGALSKICRFGSQINHFYSVAEHSINCCRHGRLMGLPLDTQAALLMHDAAEAFVGDVVKPLKIMLADYKPIEQAVENAIAEKFCIDFDREKFDVTRIDNGMLIAERRRFFSADKVEWHGERDALPLTVDYMAISWVCAEADFLKEAQLIGITPIREKK